jgi:hypothetical protein
VEVEEPSGGPGPWGRLLAGRSAALELLPLLQLVQEMGGLQRAGVDLASATVNQESERRTPVGFGHNTAVTLRSDPRWAGFDIRAATQPSSPADSRGPRAEGVAPGNRNPVGGLRHPGACALQGQNGQGGCDTPADKGKAQ